MRPSLSLPVVLAVGGVAAAADGWPEVAPPQDGGWRGGLGGLALLPAGLWLALVLGWVRTVDWVHRDAAKHGVGPARWSTVCGLPLPLAAILAWWIPWAWAALLVMALAWIVPVTVYASVRNPRVAESERILTPGHARRVVARLLARLGVEIAEPIRQEDTLPVVELEAVGGRDAAENDARVAAAKALPGFEELRRQMLAATVARAATVVLEVGAETTERHEVDGVWDKPRVRQPPKRRAEKEAWVAVPPSSRELGEAVTAAALALCGLPAGAASGTGRFALRVDGTPRTARLTVRRERAARQLVFRLESAENAFKRLADVGLPAEVAARVGGLLAAERGLVLVSAPAGSGLSTTADLLVESADRLLRDFISLEDAAQPPREIQNVKPVRFDARTGVAPLAALADALREYPAAIVARDVRDRDVVAELVRLAAGGKLVIMSLKASDAIEAVTRVLACGVPPQQLGEALLGSLAQRLARRLCPKCREDVPPPPQLLERLKLTAEQLPHVRTAAENGCRLCQGSGYVGRVGVFELASGGTLRRMIAAAGDPEQLRQAAVRDGMRPLKEAALRLVVDGVTSLEEVQRTLASTPAAAPPAAAARNASAGRSGRSPS